MIARRALGLIALAVVALPAAAVASLPSIGVNAAIRNQVKQQGAGESTLHPAVLRDSVHIGDQMVSGPNSALQVLLKDESVFTVGANAKMTIDKFVYDPSRGTGAVAASVVKGAFRFMSGNAVHANPGQIAIKTPVASIGVRGTVVEVMVGQETVDLIAREPTYGMMLGSKADPATATIIVLRGPGPNRQGFDKVGAISVTGAGKTVEVTHPGFALVGGPGQAPLGPFPLPPSISTALDSSLRTEPSTNGQRAQAASIVQQIKDAQQQAQTEQAFRAMLDEIVLQTGLDPIALQDALADYAATLKKDSDEFTTLEAISYLLSQTSGDGADGILATELASAGGSTLASSFPSTTDFAGAVNSLGNNTGSNGGIFGGGAGSFPPGLGDFGGSEVGSNPPKTPSAPPVDVPEPTSWVMMIAGFMMIGQISRRGHPRTRQIA